MRLNSWLNAVAHDDPWDVIVLGAGPAGAVAARQLALAKLRVLLIEKASLPRFKVCGGCLGGAALHVLENIGLGHLPAQCGGAPLDRMELANAGSIASIPVGRCVAVCRREFDELLVNEAANAGAVVYDGVEGMLPSLEDYSGRGDVRPVKLRRGGSECVVFGRAVIIATGLAGCPSPFKSQTSTGSLIGLGALLECDRRFTRAGMLQMGCSASGYVGVAPLGDGRLDIAAAVDPRTLAAVGSASRLIDRILRESGLPAPENVNAVHWRGTPPLTRTTRPLAAHRCLLVGDAAGYVEPFTGEGIGWAMQSALLASSIVLKNIESWSEAVTEQWQHTYDSVLLSHQRTCRTITRLLRHATVRRLTLWSLRRAPVLARPLVHRLQRPL